MTFERVKEYFDNCGLGNKIKEFDVSSATVLLAAEALQCEPKRIAKSISFIVGDRAILIVAAGDVKIDNSKYKVKFGVKAKMLSPEQVQDYIGYAAGGVCPFLVKEGVSIYLDESLKRFETVFPACGSSNSTIELTISQLEEHTHFQEWVDVCKGW